MFTFIVERLKTKIKMAKSGAYHKLSFRRFLTGYPLGRYRPNSNRLERSPQGPGYLDGFPGQLKSTVTDTVKSLVAILLPPTLTSCGSVLHAALHGLDCYTLSALCLWDCQWCSKTCLVGLLIRWNCASKNARVLQRGCSFFQRNENELIDQQDMFCFNHTSAVSRSINIVK